MPHAASSTLGRARFPFLTQAIEHLHECFIRMCANDQVAASEDVCGNRVDSSRLSLAAAVIQELCVAVLVDRRPQVDLVEPNLSADSNEIVGILEPAGSLPVSLEERPVHLVEFALFARELGSPQGLPRVDDHVALPHHKTNLIRDRLQATPHLLRATAPEVRLAWDPLDRRFRMKLVRKPGQADETFVLKAFDSERVDVAPGSNVVGEDDEVRGHMPQVTSAGCSAARSRSR